MNELKVNVYSLLSDCVDRGIENGWNKAHKHIDTPNKESILEQIHKYIMLNVEEYFKFEN